MKIYTKTGDAGHTGLLGGSRIAKNSTRIIAIGDVDELNAVVGFARTSATEGVHEMLLCVQNWLFELGAELASPPGARKAHCFAAERATQALESSIDQWTADLPPLSQFILPGGGTTAALLHLARCVCRRAERSLLELHSTSPQRSEVLAFLNRLSDWLFVAARKANQLDGISDVPWTPA